MVLKAGEHPMREIEQAVKRLQQADVNLRGILFNDVKASSPSLWCRQVPLPVHVQEMS